HRVSVDQLGRFGDRDTVAAPDEGVALDHRRERGVHTPRPERDNLSLARGLLATSRLGGDARGLAEETEQRRLVLRPLDIRALDAHHRLIRLEENTPLHRPPPHPPPPSPGPPLLPPPPQTPP